MENNCTVHEVSNDYLQVEHNYCHFNCGDIEHNYAKPSYQHSFETMSCNSTPDSFGSHLCESQPSNSAGHINTDCTGLLAEHNYNAILTAEDGEKTVLCHKITNNTLTVTIQDESSMLLSPSPTADSTQRCHCSPMDIAHCFQIPVNIIPQPSQLSMDITCAITPYDDILRISNRYAQNTIGDGNCYFRCLSLHFFGIEDFHTPVRQSIVSFMADNLHQFEHDISLTLNPSVLSVQQYLANMYRVDGSVHSWATDIEIEASATYLQTPIYVLGRFGSSISWQRFAPKFYRDLGQFQSAPCITLLNTGSHYMLVRPIHSDCNCWCDPPMLALNGQANIVDIDLDGPLAVTPKRARFNSPDSNVGSSKLFSHFSGDIHSSSRDQSEATAYVHSVKSRKSKPSKKIEPGAKFLEAIFQGPSSVCASCEKLYYSTSVKEYAITDQWSKLLHSLLKPNQITIPVCSRCYTSLKQNKLPPLCVLNQIRVDAVPDELKILNSAERKMIALAHVYMKMVILPFGQKAINGQVINFPYDVQEQVDKFSHQGLVLVRVAGQKEGTIPKQYVVDTNKVIAALKWLKSHNVMYSNITIPSFACEQSLPPVISISSDAKYVHEQKTGTNDGWLPESSVVNKDPVLPKIDYSKFVDDLHMPVQDIPRNTNVPSNIYSDAYLEEMAFPTLFPNGKNGLRTPRRLRLTVLQYVQSRLLSFDNRWQSDLSYLFWATNITEKEKLSEGINIAARIRGSNSNSRSRNLTAANVRDDLKNNPDYPENFFGFMKGIRGSAAYWNAAKLDLLSMIKSKGPMTFFLTLSANDMNWDDLMSVLLHQSNRPNSSDDIAKLTKQQKTDLMVANPITTARHFCRRVHHIIHSYILSDEKPLGEIIDYFWRIEFQMRGSPHLHSLWWVQDAPNLDTEEGRADAPAFIDRYISTEIPQDDPFMKRRVEALQRHKHTHTCRKYKNDNQYCRFGFPHTLASKTTLKSVDQLLTSPHCYTLKRSPGSENVNAYNTDILRVWNANMDIQLVGSAQGTAKYVCSYICKAESDEILHSIREAVQNLPEDASTKRQLHAIGNVFLSHRQLSAQEASFKMCGLPLRGASTSSIFVNARPEEERSRLLKPKKHLEQLQDDSSDIFCSNIFQRYKHRPNNPDFESMTLATFAVWYTSCKDSKNAIELQDGAGFIRKRQKELVLRTPKFNVDQDGDKYYFSFLLLYLPWRNESDLLKGFTSAEEAFHKCYHLLQQTASGSKYAEEIERAIKQIQTLHDSVLKNYIAPVVAPNTEAYDNDLHDSGQCVKEDPSNANFFSPTTFDTNLPGDPTCYKPENNMAPGHEDDKELNHMSFTRLTDLQYMEDIHQLNTDQLQAFQMVKKYFDDLNAFQSHLSENQPEPIHLFISGPGGTGKSHLIALIQELIVRSSLETLSKDSPAAVIMAPTGVAAFNIKGVTIHRALNLPVQHGPTPKYTPLTGERLAQMRKYWRNTNTIIIDEISMVSYETFVHIHKRLNDIKCVAGHSFFGNLNVIVLGDFYQLPPVSPGHFIFAGISEKTHLWKDLFTMIELLQNMRQKNDQQYAEVLLRIRTASHTQDDIRLLQKQIADSALPHENAFADALYLFPILKSCHLYNMHRLQSISHSSVVYTISAKHSFAETPRKSAKSISVAKTFIPDDERECAGLPNDLTVCIGAVVMLRRNVNTSAGLVNGARGVVTEFVWKNGISPKNPAEGLMPEKIMVQFFHCNSDQSKKTAVPIEPVTAEFYAKHKTVLVRKQFPLTLSWAATIHKTQGVTLSQAVVDLGKDVFCPGMAYVALSRVKQLQGLSLLALEEGAIFCSPLVANEMERLRIKSRLILPEL